MKNKECFEKQIKKREQELLNLEFKRNDDQQSWIKSMHDQIWYVDFHKVLGYNESEWNDCIENIKQSYTRAKNSIESSELYLLGKKSAQKEIEQKINNLIKKYDDEINRIHTLENTEQYAKTRMVNTLWDKIQALKELI